MYSIMIRNQFYRIMVIISLMDSWDNSGSFNIIDVKDSGFFP